MQLMTWFAEYKDGKVFKEKEIEFQDIIREDIKYFGLEGMESKFSHEVTTGQILLDDNKICCLLDDKLIGRSNDVINFKEKRTTFLGDAVTSDIVGYYTGWKEHNEEFQYIEVLFWVDMITQNIKIRLRITPSKTTCKFNLIINGVLNERILEFEEIGRKKEFVFEL
jgi:inorganic pyrophosphatase/exopolyphosphatase